MPMLTHVSTTEMDPQISLEWPEFHNPGTDGRPLGMQLWLLRKLMIPEYDAQASYVISAFGGTYSISEDGYDILTDG